MDKIIILKSPNLFVVTKFLPCLIFAIVSFLDLTFACKLISYFLHASSYKIIALIEYCILGFINGLVLYNILRLCDIHIIKPLMHKLVKYWINKYIMRYTKENNK